ncbi:hypothetical protein AB1Y20_020795 [Prymnesium parvum]|uniref:NADH:ubiquinone oxidoreductase intermediate-associated protein 30 domain-containing protein n=1 Tax=Prymnesium parvum TaxID=97485 RepID=A0AB34K0G4_PRYPA
MFVLLAAAAAAAFSGASASCEPYRKVTSGECADSCLDSFVGVCPRSVVVKAGGLDTGRCASVGFTVSDGSIEEKAGPCGTLHFDKYTHAAGLAAAAEAVPLVTFDGAPSTTFTFAELNDPVMGGQSRGTWAQGDGYGVIDGEVVDVPSLKAPGFIKSSADGKFADVSAAAGGELLLEVRSTTPDYKGFRVSFASGTAAPAYSCAGGGSIPFSRGCFKAKFSVPAGGEWSVVRIPFASFSDKWSPATGEQTSTCAADHDVCPTAKTLGRIKRFEFWAEGVDGKVHLEVKSVRAAPASLASAPHLLGPLSSSPPKEFMSCSGPLQHTLRFGISGRTEPTVPVPVDQSETLADAVCCDRRVEVYAEPQFLFEAPDVALFSHLNASVNTFYDSVCGLPLFRAPVNRTMEEFKADTQEHGWPSFRAAEVIAENVIVDHSTGFVTSKCGTHLGSYLPDKKGPRWCMDLSCIAGVESS